MYFVRIPSIIKKIFPSVVFDIPNNENKIYLTFDDGPHPEITIWILEQLKKHQAKATFFCLGVNIEKHPEVILKIKEENHAIGHHSYSHFNAWKIDKYDFIKDVEKGYQTLEKNGIKSILFRPPHGKLKNLHLQKFKSKYKIINWSLMPGDFDLSISKTTCLNRLKKIKSGDIVVLHDNEKSWKHLHYCLPLFLEFCDENNFQCVVLEQ